VVATVGVVAVHPGSSLRRSSALGQDVDGAFPTGGGNGGLASIASETNTMEANSAAVASHIDAQGTRQELDTNVHARTTADDELEAATAETVKAKSILKQKDLELLRAQADVDMYRAAAFEGGPSDMDENAALTQTAALSADKRTYLITRNTYAASTLLVATNKALLQRAKAASATAMQAFTQRKAAADANRAEAEQMAMAMTRHNKETKAAAAVGEESTADGVSRSITMAQISENATRQELLGIDIQTAAAVLKQKWADCLLEQKTAQETLDAEEVRNAGLAATSNKMQKEFIDSSHVAAIDATAAADAKKKAAADLADASKQYAAALVAREAARKEVERLADVQEIRSQELAAQSAKTDSVKAKSDVMDAMEEEAGIATKVEETKDVNNRNAVVNAIAADLEGKEDAAAAAKAAADKATVTAQVNAITQAAMDQPVPRVVTDILQNTAVTEAPASTAAEVSLPDAPAAEPVDAPVEASA
jgi:hypothetical protein